LEQRCEVCGGPLDEENVSRCRLCGRKFHMAWSVHAPVENCGRVWFNEMACSMGFICNICVAENPQLSGSLIDTQQPPI